MAAYATVRLCPERNFGSLADMTVEIEHTFLLLSFGPAPSQLLRRFIIVPKLIRNVRPCERGWIV